MDMREMDCCLGVSSILSDPKSPSAYLSVHAIGRADDETTTASKSADMPYLRVCI